MVGICAVTPSVVGICIVLLFRGPFAQCSALDLFRPFGKQVETVWIFKRQTFLAETQRKDNNVASGIHLTLMAFRPACNYFLPERNLALASALFASVVLPRPE